MNPLLYYICWARYKGTLEEYSWLSSTDVRNTSKLISCLKSNKTWPKQLTFDHLKVHIRPITNHQIPSNNLSIGHEGVAIKEGVLSQFLVTHSHNSPAKRHHLLSHAIYNYFPSFVLIY